MKRTITFLSLVLALTVAVIAHAAPAQQTKPEHLSKQQLNTLIASAKTPTEHQRIADFYAASAQDYRAQAQEHAAMIANYKSSTGVSNDKNRTSTIGHCEYFVKSLNDLAIKSDELAKLHREMAQEVGSK